MAYVFLFLYFPYKVQGLSSIVCYSFLYCKNIKELKVFHLIAFTKNIPFIQLRNRFLTLKMHWKDSLWCENTHIIYYKLGKIISNTWEVTSNKLLLKIKKFLESKKVKVFGLAVDTYFFDYRGHIITHNLYLISYILLIF